MFHHAYSGPNIVTHRWIQVKGQGRCAHQATPGREASGYRYRTAIARHGWQSGPVEFVLEARSVPAGLSKFGDERVHVVCAVGARGDCSHPIEAYGCCAVSLGVGFHEVATCELLEDREDGECVALLVRRRRRTGR